MLEASLAASAEDLWAVIERQRSGSRAALRERARAIYSAWGLEPHPPRATVLVVLETVLGDVALETGQGVEGPFTEVDAERMRANVAPLLRASRWQEGLTTLISAVTAAAEATRARRRREPAVTEPAPPPEAPTAAAPGAETARAADHSAGPPASRGLFTRLTAVVSGAVVLLLALRQRRRNQARPPLAPPSDRPKRLGPPRIDR